MSCEAPSFFPHLPSFLVDKIQKNLSTPIEDDQKSTPKYERFMHKNGMNFREVGGRMETIWNIRMLTYQNHTLVRMNSSKHFYVWIFHLNSKGLVSHCECHASPNRFQTLGPLDYTRKDAYGNNLTGSNLHPLFDKIITSQESKAFPPPKCPDKEYESVCRWVLNHDKEKRFSALFPMRAPPLSTVNEQFFKKFFIGLFYMITAYSIYIIFKNLFF